MRIFAAAGIAVALLGETGCAAPMEGQHGAGPGSAGVAGSAGTATVEPTSPDAVQHHRACYSGGVFLPMDKARLAAALPTGLVPRDASVFGEGYRGEGMAGISFWSCPASEEGSAHAFALIVSLVRTPVAEAGLDSVRLHWFEHARLVDGEELSDRWRGAGLKVTPARLTHEPFTEGDRTNAFSAMVGADVVCRITTGIERSVDFPGQTLAFWQDGAEGLVYSLFAFEPHHSSLGEVSDCSLDLMPAGVGALGNPPCRPGALTEVIERIDFASSVHRWTGGSGGSRRPDSDAARR